MLAWLVNLASLFFWWVFTQTFSGYRPRLHMLIVIASRMRAVVNCRRRRSGAAQFDGSPQTRLSRASQRAAERFHVRENLSAWEHVRWLSLSIKRALANLTACDRLRMHLRLQSGAR